MKFCSARTDLRITKLDVRMNKNIVVRVPENEDYDYQRAMHESYVGRKKSLDAAHLEISGRYSHWLITIAGGALAVSVTFLEKIAPNPLPHTHWIISICWVLLVGSLLGGFYAIYCSGNAIIRQRKINEYKYASYRRSINDKSAPAPTIEDDCINRYSECIPAIDKLSVGALIGGLIFLCLFSFVNMPNENHKQQSENHIGHMNKDGNLDERYVPEGEDIPPPKRQDQNNPDPGQKTETGSPTEN